MEINITTKQVLRILYVLAWIIFIGVSIEAGGFIFNGILSLVLNPEAARHLWQQVDLSGLIAYDRGYFLTVSIFMSIVAVMKALLFYLIIKILHGNKLDMAQPFNKAVGRFVFNMSYLTLGIGIFSWWGVGYTGWLKGKGIGMPAIEAMRLGGADVWLFMCVVLFVIAQMFKRGIEIQTENDLTV